MSGAVLYFEATDHPNFEIIQVTDKKTIVVNTQKWTPKTDEESLEKMMSAHAIYIKYKGKLYFPVTITEWDDPQNREPEPATETACQDMGDWIPLRRPAMCSGEIFF